MKAATSITNFNAGEISPLIEGRFDLKMYPNACRRMRNFIPAPQGPARRRPGTRFVAEVKNSGSRVWLVKFEFSADQAYVMEFGPEYIRFFANRGPVGGPPFEVVTPYLSGDLTAQDGSFNLKMTQSGDVVYIFHRFFQTRKLTRTGPGTFVLTIAPFDDGPFDDIIPNNPASVSSNGVTGGVVLTFTAPVFPLFLGVPLQDLVGSLILIEQKAVDAVKYWEPNKAGIVINDVRRSDGKTYLALTAGTTGSVKPIHAHHWLSPPPRAARMDGDNGVQWEFQDPGYGWVKILLINSDVSCNAGVLSRLPAAVVGAPNATPRWSFGSWTPYAGYPTHGVFFRERLVTMRDRNLWASVAGDFESHMDRDDGGVVTPESSMALNTLNDKADPVQWMVSMGRALLIGTGGDEHALTVATENDPFGSGNAQINPQSSYGARGTPPLKVGDSVIFVQRSGRKLREMRIAESVEEKWVAADMTILSEHITKSGIIDITYQQERDSIVWAVMADGRLGGFTYNREQEIKGWHQHRIGGYADVAETQFAAVESIVSCPSPDGGSDDLWMVVRRTIDGATKRYVEYMTEFHEKGDDPENVFFVDSGLTLNNVQGVDLAPGNFATIKGSEGVPFLTAAPYFDASHVGKFIHYRHSTVNVKGETIWKTAIAEITSLFSPTMALCTIRSPWPSVAAPSVIAGGIAKIETTPGYSFDTVPVFSFIGGSGAGAVAEVKMQLMGVTIPLVGLAYAAGDIIGPIGGSFTRPARIRVVSAPAGGVLAGEVIDGGDYSVLPGAPIMVGGVPGTGPVTTAMVSGGAGIGCEINCWWGISPTTRISNPGSGFTSNPLVAMAPGSGIPVAATATATISADPGLPVAGVPAVMLANTWRLTATIITGLDHLEGEVVDICADGAAHAQKTVIGGGVELDVPASKVHIGLPCPAVLMPMPVESGAADGASHGKTKRSHRVAIKFHETMGCKYGRDEDAQMDRVLTRGGGDEMDSSLALFTGDKVVAWPDGYNSEHLITIVQDQPLPCTVVAISPQLTTEDNR